MDPEKDSNMVESLLVFKSKLTHLISSSFRTNPSYNQALTKSFESFINKRENRPAELIAKYLDALLKSGGGSGRAAAAIAAIRAGESNAAAAAAARVATAANDEQHPSSSAPPPPRASLLSSTNSANSSSENVSMLPFTQTDDEMVEQVMGEVISLFRYVEGKDVFEAFYKKDLAKRLLMGKSASIDLEKSMVARIRAGRNRSVFFIYIITPTILNPSL